MSCQANAVEWARIAASAAADKKATDIVALDVSGVFAITDVFLICSAVNQRQVAAVVDEIEFRLKQAGAAPPRREGQQEGRWVLLDFGDIVAHVQLREERELYGLERLWRDCPALDVAAAAV
ncbi:MAG: ribosome silencing factor [Candidatus Nanopelagicales bacterium]|nr:ribosome silencing factor [Candidatus Nanopelagicales bacterium]MDZ4250489.1 ribosome silencing factor [Candidatus Nanopelagicales bacterium]MDZ7577379.1 ribosome silencing factor [Candidatus Nanopelagicales bacterium]